MEDDADTGPQPTGALIAAERDKRTSWLDLTKIVLDFLSKCLYPAIIGIILFLIWPGLASIDFHKLVDRLQSAKAGDFEFTFGQAQDVGAEMAPLNNKIVALENTVSALQADLRRLQGSGKAVKQTDEQLKAQAAAEQAFKANSVYTVLVFHRIESRSRASTITQALLKAGYTSSDTETDFSELRKVKPEPNLIFITYTETGMEALPSIERKIKSLVPDAEVRRNPRAISLRRGDVQVLVF